jgi:SAM-dependent methyltransferase
MVRSTKRLTVQYLDRWDPDENASLFPELAGEQFPKPDIVADLNAEALQAVASESQDFVVCSHVLEHVANPLRVLTDMWRVLKPGGLLLILLPDRRKTFDQGRSPTPLDHVVADYEVECVEVDDEHLLEFMTHVGVDEETVGEARSGSERGRAILDYQRRRSIHVHCWTLEEFAPVIEYAIRALGNNWVLVDGLLTEDQGPESIEFGFLLQRCVAEVPSEEVAKLFIEDLATLVSRRESLASADWRARRLAAAEHDLNAIRQTKTFRYSRAPREVYSRLRQRSTTKPASEA